MCRQNIIRFFCLLFFTLKFRTAGSHWNWLRNLAWWLLLSNDLTLTNFQNILQAGNLKNKYTNSLIINRYKNTQRGFKNGKNSQTITFEWSGYFIDVEGLLLERVKVILCSLFFTLKFSLLNQASFLLELLITLFFISFGLSFNITYLLFLAHHTIGRILKRRRDIYSGK